VDTSVLNMTVETALHATSSADQSDWVGIGWRQPHYRELLERRPSLAFIEVHSENFYAEGGAALAVLQRGRDQYPVSLHGVGLGLGSAVGLDPWHLAQLSRLVERIDPVRVSDHASFARVPSSRGMVHASDLLPLAFDATSLNVLARNVEQVQAALRRPILVENLSAYVHWQVLDEACSEPAFFNALARRTGCGLLLDVNNLVVNALNASRAGGVPASRCEQVAIEQACAWIDALDPAIVGEIHLAGYHAGAALVIDDHGSRVHAPVWAVYRHALARLGPRPTLIEWDTAVPALDVLLDEAHTAARCISQCTGKPALCSAAMPFTPACDSADLVQAQAALVAAVWDSQAPQPALQGQPAQIAHGLTAYRQNAWAVAERALAAAYPTVQQLLGEQAFAGLARALWQADPPQLGDLACWGEALAAYFAGPGQLEQAPYLPDMARLDWSVHRAGCAVDPAPTVHGLELLATAAPDRLHLQWSDGSGLLSSAYPVASLWAAHRSDDPALMAQAGQACAQGVGEQAWWWRDGWQVRVQALDAATAAWHLALLDGCSLGAALERVLAQQPDFDFGRWLQRALQHGWLAALHVTPARSTEAFEER